MNRPVNAGHTPEDDRAPWTLKMKDLCGATGLTRQAIHYYIQAGLLPPGRKTGRNQAFYSPEHIERLRRIRQLQHERFLPLKAIKALFDERDETLETFAPEQQAFLRAVQANLPPRAPKQGPATASELVERGLIEADDLDGLIEEGIVAAQKGADGVVRVHPDDVDLVALLGQLRAAGVNDEAGFEVSDVRIYEQAVRRLVQAETALVVKRTAHESPEAVAALIERASPIINALVCHLRERRIQDLLSTL